MTPTRALLVVIACALSPAAARAASHACEFPGAVVTQQARLRIDGQALIAAALSLPDPNDDKSRLLILDRRCKPLWSATVDGAQSRIDRRRLGRTDIVHFVTMRVFGDGTGYVHRLLALHANRPTPILPPIDNTAKDGFYLGRLTGGGEGIVTWSADPTGDAEADPHPYVVTLWRWSQHHLGKPTRHERTQKYLASQTEFPRADSVARAMRLPYRDQTGIAGFMD